MRWRGKPVEKLDYNNPQTLEIHIRNNADNDYTGSIMPPPEAVKAGKLTAFGYWLDFDAESGLQAGLDPRRVSNETFGARLAGERPLSTDSAFSVPPRVTIT